MKKNVWIHLGIVAVMLVVACVYMAPALEGKVILQGDTMKYEAMVKENMDYQRATGEYTHWNSAMFSGMPGYQVGGNPPVKSVLRPIHRAGTLQFFGFERDAGVLFFYLIGFYIAMLAFGCTPWISLLGALAFGLGSYNIIIVEAGHITKAWAMAMMAPILAGMVLCLRDRPQKRKEWLWGGLLFTVALGLQLHSNHIQITFYTILGALILGAIHMIWAIKGKYLKSFAVGVGILIIGAMLAFSCNSRNLMVSQQYAPYTMRGGNDITVTPEDLYHDSEPASMGGKTTGLDINYAFSWSYGVDETYTLLVPGAKGGGSGEKVGTESAFYKTFHSEQAPLYWGNQPFTSGPVYFGAIIIFLFVLGCLVVKGPERWWLLIATILAILMSWGNNFMAFNEFLFNHLPMYNKFRTPSMSLVIANVTMVMMAVLTLKAVFDKKNPIDRKMLNRSLYIATGVVGGLILVVLLLSGSFSYTGASDQQMAAQYGPQWDMIKSVLVSDRAALLRSDSWRSLLFVVLAGVVLWLYNNEKLKKAWIVIAAIAVLIVIDLWGVDRRYVNNDNFVEKGLTELHRDQWDYDIDKMAAQFGDKDYRVLNLATNTFNDSKPAAFHHQLGGYSAVKMRRYQDVIDFYMSRHINMSVLNMLNARYIVIQGGQVQRNPEALDNAWFVREVKPVQNANEEILALNDFNPATTAIINTHEFESMSTEFCVDTTATIEMEHQMPYNPDYLKYRTHSTIDQLAVFSEIYYEPDWRAYIDGKPAEYIRANYILRAMVVPAGDHVIEFRNEAPLFHQMDIVTIVGSIMLVLLAAGSIFLVYRKKKK